MEETNIKSWFKSEARKDAHILCNECDGSYVGAESKRKVKYKGYNYELFVVAFWESSNHFDYSVTGLDREYKQSGSLIDF
jgi:hypothetical protein